MTAISKARRSNGPLIIMMFVLIVFGLIILYSVSGPAGYGKNKDSFFYVRKQIQYTLLGLGVCIALNFFPVKKFNNRLVCLIAYGSSLALIILTAVAGKSINGAKRWIGVGALTFQTSEYVKIGIIVALASYRALIIRLRDRGKLKAPNPNLQSFTDAFFDFILPVGAALLIDVFILVQPHTSCFLIVGFVIFICMLSSGISLRSWFIGGLVILLAGVIAFTAYTATHPDYMDNFQHVVQRINIFTTQHEEDEEAAAAAANLTADDTRQVDNAHNALGSGGMWGMGLGNSRSKYSYVSEAQNDYIFSIYVEETGFVGGAILILMYLVFFGMCVMVVMRTDSIFTRMLAVGYTSLIMIQVLLNISVELQLIPATGVTLPFISYGGTAQIFLMAAYGMILCVSRSGTEPVVREKRK